MKAKKSECGIECLDFVYDALERKTICKKCGRVVTMGEVIEGLKGAIRSAEYTDVEEACKIAILILQEQEERERTSADAFGDIAWYNGHMEWLETIRKEMMECDGFYMCPVRPKEWNTDKHTLWMFLCGMFGNWGTSIRAGWIEEKEKAVAFIEKAIGKFEEGVEEK